MRLEVPGSRSASGKVRRIFSSNGLTFSEVSLPGKLRLPVHKHDMAQMAIVLRGSHTEAAGAICATLRPGTILIRPACELHSNYVKQSGSQTLLIDFEPDRFRGLGLQKCFLRTALFRSSALGLFPGDVEAEVCRSDQGSAAALEGMMLMAVGRAIRLAGTMPACTQPVWLEKAVVLVRENYRERLSLQNMSRILGVHPVTLATLFKRFTGTSIGRTILKLRVDEARELLFETDLPLANIAQRLGFYDQSHFGRIFKRHLGCSPARFRRDGLKP